MDKRITKTLSTKLSINGESGYVHARRRTDRQFEHLLKQAVGGRPPRYAPAPLLPHGRRSALRRRADVNVAAVSHGQYVPTPTAAAVG